MTACVAFALVRLPSTVWSPSVERLCCTASTSKPVTAAAPGIWSVGFQVTDTEVLSTERTMLAEPGCGAPASPGPAGQPPMPGPPPSPYPAMVGPGGLPSAPSTCHDMARSPRSSFDAMSALAASWNTYVAVNWSPSNFSEDE